MLTDAKRLAADRALDQAWRSGVGVARAVTVPRNSAIHSVSMC